jgi:hypothetical protein
MVRKTLCQVKKNLSHRTVYILPKTPTHYKALTNTHITKPTHTHTTKQYKTTTANPQAELYMQFHGISFMHLYRQSDRGQNVLGG